MSRTRLGAAVAGALLGAALCAAAAGEAEATVLYQQAPGNPASWVGVVSAGSFAAFDDFSLSDQARVTSVGWAGSTTSSGQFQIGIYASVPGVPINLPAATPSFQVTVSATPTPDATFPFYAYYTADIGTGFVLAADTQYWLSIRNVTPGVNFWVWNAARNGVSVGQTANGFHFNGLSPFFTLSGSFVGDLVAVAEPASVALFSLGLAALGVGGVASRRRRPASRRQPLG